ncbi:MAG: acetyl-CoA carboxylase biotin carboxyl carrier protein [Planctomycetota bacterium]|jgi:acetyl-CoA carboxylase biotin carboxyl carrier protein|nr:acetyl-CoA carboxylase biotin carboxyl carrier protein [Blastopirellula sp.]
MKPEKKMGNERENETAVFDVNRIRQLIELMNEHELNEIDLRHDERRIRLRRGELQNFVGVPTMMPAQAAHSAPAQPAAAVAAPAAAPDPGAKSAPAAEEAGVFIKSPMVGTFYSRPKPTAAPYVKVGDVIQPDTVVCLVEAMKTFNELPAGIAGKVVAVLVKDEEPIDVNRPLFKVVPV